MTGDSAWSLFRAYNFLDHHIRHADHTLRVAPIFTAAEREDATFRVGH
ncbi:AbfB domain-containing protein [Streptomyces sp. Qhu-G9]